MFQVHRKRSFKRHSDREEIVPVIFPPLYTSTGFWCFIAEPFPVWCVDSEYKSVEGSCLSYVRSNKPFFADRRQWLRTLQDQNCTYNLAQEDHMLLEQNCWKMLLHNVSDKAWQRQRRGGRLPFVVPRITASCSARNSNAAAAKAIKQHKAPMVSSLLCHVAVLLPLHSPPRKKKKSRNWAKKPCSCWKPFISPAAVQISSEIAFNIVSRSPAKEMPPHFLLVEMLYEGGGGDRDFESSR